MDKSVDNLPFRGPASTLPDMATVSKKRLTPKQTRFAEAVAAGHSLTAAYRLAYDAENMSAAATRNEASKLMANPEITLMVEGLQAERQRQQGISEVSDRDRVLEKLRVMMDTAKTETVQLNAAIALGKSVALFTDVSEVRDDRRTAADVQAELDALLDQVAGAGDNVIPISKA